LEAGAKALEQLLAMVFYQSRSIKRIKAKSGLTELVISDSLTLKKGGW
jgi:hypothetical protein